MDKLSKKEELFTKQLVKEAGLSKPSVDFTKRVMEVVAAKSSIQEVYQPLISKRVWGVLAGVMAICLVLLFVIPIGNEPLFGTLEMHKYMNFSIPELKLSKTMLYALGCTALFLVQIPFLKHYLGKQYK
jgi:hypothetical protein